MDLASIVSVLVLRTEEALRSILVKQRINQHSIEAFFNEIVQDIMTVMSGGFEPYPHVFVI